MLAFEDESMDVALEALRKRIARWTDKRPLFETAIPGLLLYRQDAPTRPQNALYEPSVCLVAQGAKRALLGNESHVYDAHHYLIASVHLPSMVQIVEASREKPCLGLVLKLDRREISQLMVDGNLPKPGVQQTNRGMGIGETTTPLLDAFRRLIDLLTEERDMPILAQVIRAEITYRLLVGDQGDRMRQIATAGSRSHQVARAIDWLKVNFSKPFRVDDLAALARMSTSTFNHHFRSMTALSPLQFQKQMRLQEARRLMLAERMDAATAAFQVGYESPSQFSREYCRLFGKPPLCDITKLRQMATGQTA